eukprot:1148716-Pelagomonas_calceolata.AAC.2
MKLHHTHATKLHLHYTSASSDQFLPEAQKMGQEGTYTDPRSSRPSAIKFVLSQPAPSLLSQGGSKELVEMSFDIVVSTLEPPEAGLPHK